MKTNLTLSVIALFLIFSCSPKVAIQASSQPNEQLPTVTAEPAPVATATESSIAEGKRLNETSCVTCHKLFKPTDFSLTEWTPILKRMQKKARLDDMQMAAIHDYIASETK